MLLFIFTAVSAVGFAQSPAPALRWQAGDQTLAVETDPLPPDQLAKLSGRTRSDADWAGLLAVFTEPVDAVNPRSNPPPKLPAAAGSWSIVDQRLRFVLRFPPAPGLRYRAELHLPGQAPVAATFQTAPRSMIPTTSVVQVFPSSDLLPENQLKFYVQFSAPMSRGDVYRHLQLLDNQGRAIELPFLELDEELWDPAMTRLTLLIDPGRIKRGVKPLEDTGPVFEEGKSYRLVLDSACRDAEGRPLRSAFTKSFRVGPADRTAPDPARWKITAPSAGSLQPLLLDFDEPMDQALALRLITLAAEPPAAAPEGTATLAAAERRWNFTPNAPWARGRYRIVVTPTIEDLAGNNIGKTFDVDLVGGASPRMAEEPVSVRFEVK